jgi:hypothetical protein
MQEGPLLLESLVRRVIQISMMYGERPHICSLRCVIADAICSTRAKDRTHPRTIKVSQPHGAMISLVITDRRTHVLSCPGF